MPDFIARSWVSLVNVIVYGISPMQTWRITVRRIYDEFSDI
jgi:hypothetical protein